MLHVNTFLWRLKESLRTQAHLFGQGNGKRERAEVFQVLVGLLGQLVCVVLHLLTVNKSHTHTLRIQEHKRNRKCTAVTKSRTKHTHSLSRRSLVSCFVPSWFTMLLI